MSFVILYYIIGFIIGTLYIFIIMMYKDKKIYPYTIFKHIFGGDHYIDDLLYGIMIIFITFMLYLYWPLVLIIVYLHRLYLRKV